VCFSVADSLRKRRKTVTASKANQSMSAYALMHSLRADVIDSRPATGGYTQAERWLVRTTTDDIGCNLARGLM
jgi:hypothetical protein